MVKERVVVSIIEIRDVAFVIVERVKQRSRGTGKLRRCDRSVSKWSRGLPIGLISRSFIVSGAYGKWSKGLPIGL